MKRLRKRIKMLLVEDDLNLSFIIRKYFEIKGFKVHEISNGKNALDAINKNKYDIYLIDIGLPEVNGITLLKEVRIGENTKPIIIITDKIEVANEIESFNSGCSIFHKKPIDFEVLNAQVNSLLKILVNAQIIKINGLILDRNQEIVLYQNQPLNLTKSEFELLYFFLTSENRVYKREEIIRRVFTNMRDIELSAVDTMISRLRKKLESTSVIDTVYKSGYKVNSDYVSL